MKTFTMLFFSQFIFYWTFAQDYYNATADLNMRSGPGTSHVVVATIPNREKVKFLYQENDSWWQVEYKGQQGYVSSKYLEEENSADNNTSRKTSSSSSSSTGSQASSSDSGSRASSSNKSSTQKSKSVSSSAVGWPNAYNWGIGFRLGEPSGLSVKKFLGQRALELSVGRTAFWGYNFEREFDRYDDFNDYRYLNAHLKSAVSVQLHYLFFKDLNLDGIDGFQWYAGFGPQFRILSVDYYYRYRVYYGQGAGDFIWEDRWEKATDLDFGLDGVIGLDYTFKEVPISLFTDLILFCEIFDNPFVFRFQGGIGARYNF